MCDAVDQCEVDLEEGITGILTPVVRQHACFPLGEQLGPHAKQASILSAQVEPQLLLPGAMGHATRQDCRSDNYNGQEQRHT
mgnify:FL=1